MRTIEESRVQATLSGYARIDAAAQKEIDRVNQDFNKSYGGVGVSSDQKAVAERQRQQAVLAIQQDAAAQSQQLTQKNNEETLRYDQEAAAAEARVKENGTMGWVASYRNAIAEIEAMDTERTAKLNNELASQQIDQATYSQRKADVDATANAQIVEQNQQMQQKISGVLESAFRDPVGTIKSQMEKMFFDIVAGWIMHMQVFKTLFGQTMGSLQPGQPTGATGAGGMMSTVFGAIGGGAGGGIPGTRGIANGSPNLSATGTYGPTSNSGAGGGTISAAGSGTMHASSVGSVLSSARSIGGMLNLGGSGSAAGTAAGSSPSSSAYDPILQSAQNAQTVDPNNPYGAITGITGSGGGINGTGSTGLSGGVQGAATALGVGMAGYSAEQSTVKAFESENPLQGALGDASAGATIGTMFAPGIGTAIGAGIGAAVGAAAGLAGMVSGEGGNLAARDYYNQSVLPQFLAMYNNGGSVAAVGQLVDSANEYMGQKFGAAAQQWVDDNYLNKEAALVMQRINDTAAGGRMYTTLSAGQFHSGGTISGFGDLGTSSSEGFIHAMLGETVVNPTASGTHGAALGAMNSGASPSDIAAMYAGSRTPSPAASTGDTHNWSVNALDPKSFTQFLRGGGAQQIVKETNNYASTYSGDGISG